MAAIRLSRPCSPKPIVKLPLTITRDPRCLHFSTYQKPDSSLDLFIAEKADKAIKKIRRTLASSVIATPLFADYGPHLRFFYLNSEIFLRSRNSLVKLRVIYINSGLQQISARLFIHLRDFPFFSQFFVFTRSMF
jgi:hypothetical protein